MLITFDPRFYMSYASFYVYGASRLSKLRFRELSEVTVSEEDDYRKGIAMEVESEELGKKRVFIDFNDSREIKWKFYEWADLYAKVNANPEDLHIPKLFAIGPFMGLTVWNPLKTMWMALRNHIRWKSGQYKVSLKKYLMDYAYTFVRRSRYEIYAPTCHEDVDYVFAISTLWYDNGTYNTTNRLRGDYVLACKDLYPRFDGGFFYIDSPGVFEQFPKYKEYLTEYKNLLTTTRIPIKEYLMKTKKSAIVFSTDAVLGSFGWKLTEYLAMGKCIISTPIGNAMPGDFNAGVHYYEVKDADEIYKAVEYLRNNPSERESYKENARKYFDEYLSPERVIGRIINKLREINKK